MKTALYLCCLSVSLLAASCSSKKEEDPKPTPPVVVDPYAFQAITGTLTITPVGGTAYVLRDLQLSFVPYTSYRTYSFRGHTPSGAGVVVAFTTDATDINATPKQAAVVTTLTGAAYATATNTAVDYLGSGTIRVVNGKYEGAYTAPTVSGSLAQ